MPAVTPRAELGTQRRLRKAFGWHISNALGHLALHVGRAVQLTDAPGGPDERAVSGGHDNAAAVFGNLRVNNCASVCLQSDKGALFMHPHRPRVPGDIDCKNGR